MGEVIAFPGARRLNAAQEPDTQPNNQPDMQAAVYVQGAVSLSAAFREPGAQEGALEGISELFNREIQSELAVRPHVFNTKGRRVSMAHMPKFESGKTVVCVPSSFPRTLEDEVHLSKYEALDLTIDFSFVFGAIIHGVKSSRSFASNSDHGLPVRGLSNDSFDQKQWPAGSRPEGVFVYRAAATVALYTNDLEGLLLSPPGQPIDDVDERPLQIAALSNPFEYDELMPLRPFITNQGRWPS